MLLYRPSKSVAAIGLCLTIALLVCVGSVTAEAKVVSERGAAVGIVKGFVRDNNGKPITGALVSIFRAGTLELFKQIKSATDGSFVTRLIPGKYTIIAAANGFDSASFSSEVTRSSELVYKFNLQPSGYGRTVPEKKIDRKGSMWLIRSSHIRRSIYQHREGESPIAESDSDSEETAELQERALERRTRSVVESYFGNSFGNSFTGVNFATFQPISDNSEMIVAGQYGTERAPVRIETELKLRPNADHQLRFGAALAQYASNTRDFNLGQFSLQATDEWRVRNGVIIVIGVDYSRFVGSGNDFALSPRLGLQFEANSKTRIRSSYTTQTEEKNWQSAIDLEGAQIFFREPVSIQDVYVAKGRPVMNRSSRLEFGLERLIDSRSSIEANIFVDFTAARGVGLVNVPMDFLTSEGQSFVANQHGRTNGARVVYARRLNRIFSSAAGYAFGRGQKLNASPTTPTNLFENRFFQTFFGQFAADFLSGTNVKTVFRLSPQATVFAIDPFQGRLAIYDPSLSVVVTQTLPTMGLPIRAEAVIDARNLLDYQTRTGGDEGGFRLLSQRRVLRGGIKVRF